MTRPVTVTISHELGAEGARQRVREGFDRLKTTLSGGMIFAFDQNWSSANQLRFTAKGLGQTITGVIDIFPQHVRIEAMLPGVLASLAEVITGKLEKEGALLLEKK